MGDILDGDLVATARIISGLMKFRELLSFLTCRGLPLEMKGRVYVSCVRCNMIYVADVGLKFERAEMQMI